MNGTFVPEHSTNNIWYDEDVGQCLTVKIESMDDDIDSLETGKVDKVSGKGLSTNDYTTSEKNKLAGIAAGANKTTVDSALSTTSTNPVQNKIVTEQLNSLGALVGDMSVSSQINNAIVNKSDVGHTHNYAGSSSAGGVANSAVKLATARTITLGGYGSGSVTFDGSKNVTLSIDQIKESGLAWGGKNISGSFGPLDASLISHLGANRLEFAKADGITVEYSRDGGSTWSDYGASNEAKTGLFSSVGYPFYIGKSSSSNHATVDCQLRVTLNTGLAGVYTGLHKFCVFVSTEGSSGCTCTIQKALESTPDTYITIADEAGIAGWSGYNIINVSSFTTYGNAPTTQYGRIRFIFKITGHNTDYNGLKIHSIQGFGGVGWVTPSHMAKHGHLYNYDRNQNATFPANVTATSFIGNASTATALTASAGSVTQPVYFANGKPVATTYTLEKSVPSNAVFTDTTYSNATTSVAGLMSPTDKVELNTLSSLVGDTSVAAQISSAVDPCITGLSISGKTITYTKNNGDTGTLTTQDTNTTYDIVTTSVIGLMSSEDKVKLDGIAVGANNYTLPAATGTVLGGVKIGSNITNSSGTISLTSSNITSALGYTPFNSANVIPKNKGGTGADLSEAPANAIIRNSGSGGNDLYYTATKSGAFYATAANGYPQFGTLPLAQGGTGQTKSWVNGTVSSLNGTTITSCQFTTSDYLHKAYIRMNVLLGSSLAAGSALYIAMPSTVATAHTALSCYNHSSYDIHCGMSSDSGLYVINCGSATMSTSVRLYISGFYSI